LNFPSSKLDLENLHSSKFDLKKSFVENSEMLKEDFEKIISFKEAP
jgi:hypothetical protein